MGKPAVGYWSNSDTRSLLPARLIVTKTDITPCIWRDYARAAGSSNVPPSIGSRGATPTNSVHIQRPIYVRIKLTVARVLVSNIRNDAFRINDKQNKTALAPKQGVGDLADLIGG